MKNTDIAKSNVDNELNMMPYLKADRRGNRQLYGADEEIISIFLFAMKRQERCWPARTLSKRGRENIIPQLNVCRDEEVMVL